MAQVWTLVVTVLPCQRRCVHDWMLCPFAHVGERASRRDPHTHAYTGITCPEMKNTGSCPRGDACPYAHSVFEYWLHETRYRTHICNEAPNCTRPICFFAHSLSELRVPSAPLGASLGGGVPTEVVGDGTDGALADALLAARDAQRSSISNEAHAALVAAAKAVAAAAAAADGPKRPRGRGGRARGRRGNRQGAVSADAVSADAVSAGAAGGTGDGGGGDGAAVAAAERRSSDARRAPTSSAGDGVDPGSPASPDGRAEALVRALRISPDDRSLFQRTSVSPTANAAKLPPSTPRRSPPAVRRASTGTAPAVGGSLQPATIGSPRALASPTQGSRGSPRGGKAAPPRPLSRDLESALLARAANLAASIDRQWASPTKAVAEAAAAASAQTQRHGFPAARSAPVFQAVAPARPAGQTPALPSAEALHDLALRLARASGGTIAAPAQIRSQSLTSALDPIASSTGAAKAGSIAGPRAEAWSSGDLADALALCGVSPASRGLSATSASGTSVSVTPSGPSLGNWAGDGAPMETASLPTPFDGRADALSSRAPTRVGSVPTHGTSVPAALGAASAASNGGVSSSQLSAFQNPLVDPFSFADASSAAKGAVEPSQAFGNALLRMAHGPAASNQQQFPAVDGFQTQLGQQSQQQPQQQQPYQPQPQQQQPYQPQPQQQQPYQPQPQQQQPYQPQPYQPLPSGSNLSSALTGTTLDSTTLSGVSGFSGLQSAFSGTVPVSSENADLWIPHCSPRDGAQSSRGQGMLASPHAPLTPAISQSTRSISQAEASLARLISARTSGIAGWPLACGPGSIALDDLIASLTSRDAMLASQYARTASSSELLAAAPGQGGCGSAGASSSS